MDFCYACEMSTLSVCCQSCSSQPVCVTICLIMMILDSFLRFRQFSLLTSPLLKASLVLMSTVTFTMLSCFLALCVFLLLCFCSLHSSHSLHTSHSSHPHPFNSPQLILSLLSVFNRLHHRWTLSLSSYPFPFQHIRLMLWIIVL
jgi:hypothetical protein